MELSAFETQMIRPLNVYYYTFGHEKNNSAMKILFLLKILFVIPLVLYAQQDSSGLFMSIEDFRANKLTYGIDCDIERHKIKLTGKDYIKIIHRDSVFTVDQEKIFGYRDCKGNSYRLVDGKSYTILNPSEYILLYMYGVPLGHGTNVEYFFSRGTDGEIMELSKESLMNAFPENADFQRKVNLIFGRSLGLTSYDKGHKMYVVNWVYQNVMNSWLE